MNPFVRNAAGHFYLESGRLQQAEIQFRASVASAANYEGWSGLAETYTLENATDKAAETWHQVLVLEPFDAHAHLTLGRLYLAQGRSTEAANEFDECLYTDPHNAEALAALHRLRPDGSSAR